MRSFKSLVWLLLAGALLILILGIGAVFNLTAQGQADDSCSSSVLLKAGLQRAGWDGGNITCQTEVKDLAGDEDDVREGLVEAHNRCKRQFATALQNDIIAGTNTFCHVCGIYDAPDVQAVSGLGEALKPIRVSGRELQATDSKHIDIQNNSAIPDELELDDPLAIIFFQDRTEDFSYLTLLGTKEVTTTSAGAGVGVVAGIVLWPLTAGVAAGLGVIGVLGAGGIASGYVTGQTLDGPDSTTYSGIVIRPYEQGVFEALNCQQLRT